jgi:hypothetical protein
MRSTAGSRDGSERRCQESDEFSTRHNGRHTSSESGVSALRPRQPDGRRTRDESIRSTIRRRRSAKATLGLWAGHGCPWRQSVGAAPRRDPDHGSNSAGPQPKGMPLRFGVRSIPRPMWCDVDPDEVSALQSNNDEDVEQVGSQSSEQRTGPWR